MWNEHFSFFKSQFFFSLTFRPPPPHPRPRNRNSFAASGILVYIKQLVSNERRERIQKIRCGVTAVWSAVAHFHRRVSSTSSPLFSLFSPLRSRRDGFPFISTIFPLWRSVAVPAGGDGTKWALALLYQRFFFVFLNWFSTERKSHLISILFELKMSMMPILWISVPPPLVDHSYTLVRSLCDASLMTDETENQVNKWTENDSKDFYAARFRSVGKFPLRMKWGENLYFICVIWDIWESIVNDSCAAYRTENTLLW